MKMGSKSAASLLEAYLDKIIEENEYKAKKNELLENKLSLQAQIKEITEKVNYTAHNGFEVIASRAEDGNWLPRFDSNED